MHTPPPRTVIKKTVLIMKTLQQQWYICHKQAYGNRQQDNAEELADNINSALTEKTLHASRHADNKIYPYHIQD